MNEQTPWGVLYAASMEQEEMTEADYALRRRLDRTYISRSFELHFPPASPDYGKPARYVRRVFDCVADESDSDSKYDEWTADIVTESPAGKRQITVQIARSTGSVRKLRIERVLNKGGSATMETLLELGREEAGRFINFMKLIEHIPAVGSETANIDDETIQAIIADPETVQRMYERSPEVLRALIENDTSAEDVVAVAARKAAIEQFRALLNDETAFGEAQAAYACGPEGVWQKFFEVNPWILGVGLSGQLLTSWDSSKLEQVVIGSSVAQSGKRTDALMRTNGIIKSMVFAEIKHHKTALVEQKPYRPGCHAPSHELSGGITQIQQTVHRSVESVGRYLADVDDDGADLPTGTYLINPRSYLIIGSLNDLRGAGGGVHSDKFRSFELYRRNITAPEIVTFDELLATAEWFVQSAYQ